MTRITRPALIAFDFEVEGSERCRVCLRTIVMCPQCCVGRECFAIASCVGQGVPWGAIDGGRTKSKE